MTFSHSEHHTRVADVFAGRWPDRTPLCEQVIPSSVATEILGRQAFTGSSALRYQEALAWLRSDAAHAEFVEQVFADAVAVHRALDLDILFLPGVGMPKPAKQISEYRLLFGDADSDNWTLWTFDPDSHQFGVLKSGTPPPDVEQVVAQMRATVAGYDPTSQTARLTPFQERAVAECGDEFVIGGSSFMSVPMKPGWLEASLLEPQLVAEHLDVVVARNLASMALQRQNGIWLFNGGGDFAYNRGPVYSPAFFEEIMAPRWKRLFDWCRENDAKYVFRSDGNLWPVAESLFGWANPHAYYEIDCDAGMHLDKLRERFPELVLMGSISCDLLQRGTAEQVREQTLRCLAAAAPRSIIASANSILHGTPLENLAAMYDTAKGFAPVTSPTDS